MQSSNPTNFVHQTFYPPQPLQPGYPLNQQAFGPGYNWTQQQQAFPPTSNLPQQPYTVTGPNNSGNNWTTNQTKLARRGRCSHCFLCMGVFGIFFLIVGIVNIAMYKSYQGHTFFEKHSDPQLVIGIVCTTLGSIFTVFGWCGIFISVLQSKNKATQPPLAYQVNSGPVMSGVMTAPAGYHAGENTYHSMADVPLNSNPCSPSAPGHYSGDTSDMAPPPYTSEKY